MTLADRTEVDSWLVSRGLLPDFKTWGNHERGLYMVPDHTRCRTELARLLVPYLSGPAGGVIAVRDTDVWSYYSPKLYVRVIAPHVPKPTYRVIQETPGVFYGSDPEPLEAAIALCLWFYWDALIVPDAATWWVSLDHDNGITFSAKPGSDQPFDPDMLLLPLGFKRLR